MTETFTYNLDNVTNIERVRWHLSDTKQPSMVWDEEITFAISEAGTWQKAVIFIIDRKLMEMGMEPDFKADWLSVDAADAYKRLTALRAKKLNEFGLTSDSVFGINLTTTSTNHYRADSQQTSEPDYTDGR